MYRASRQLASAARALLSAQQVAAGGCRAGAEATAPMALRHFASSESELKKTVLHDLHVQEGGALSWRGDSASLLTPVSLHHF